MAVLSHLFCCSCNDMFEKRGLKRKKKAGVGGEMRERERKTNCTEGLDKNGWSGPTADAVAAGEDGLGQSRDGAALCLYAAYSHRES